MHKFNIHLTAFVEGKAKLTCELKSDGSSRTKLSLHYGLSRQGATVQLVRTWRYTVNNLFRSNLPYENFSHNCQCEIQLNSILKLEETHCSVNPNCNCAVSTSSGQIPIFFLMLWIYKAKYGNRRFEKVKVFCTKSCNSPAKSTVEQFSLKSAEWLLSE